MRVVRSIVPLTLALLIALPVSGSWIEDNSDGAITYQFDDDTFADAPDSCSRWVSLHGFPTYSTDYYINVGETTTGIVVPFEDAVDFYGIVVDSSTVGMTHRVSFSLTDLEINGYPYDVIIRGPGCTTTVTYTVVATPLLGDPGNAFGNYAIEFTPSTTGTYLTGLILHTPGGGSQFQTAPPALPQPVQDGLETVGDTAHGATDTIIDISVGCGNACVGGPTQGSIVDTLLDLIGTVEIAISPFALDLAQDLLSDIGLRQTTSSGGMALSPFVDDLPLMQPQVCHQCAPQMAAAAKSFSYRGSVTAY